MALNPRNSRGAGIAPVSCVLAVPALDIASVARHGCLWSQLYDNIYDFNALTSLPTGIGVTALHNGTDETITTTEAGTWAFTMAILTSAADLTWIGLASADENWTDIELGNVVSGATKLAPQAVLAQVVALPSGALVTPRIQGSVAATAALTARVRMVIVRLG